MFNRKRGIPVPADPLATLLKGRLTPDEIAVLPRGWQIIGEVALVHVPPLLQAKKAMIAEGF